MQPHPPPPFIALVSAAVPPLSLPTRHACPSTQTQEFTALPQLPPSRLLATLTASSRLPALPHTPLCHHPQVTQSLTPNLPCCTTSFVPVTQTWSPLCARALLFSPPCPGQHNPPTTIPTLLPPQNTRRSRPPLHRAVNPPFLPDSVISSMAQPLIQPSSHLSVARAVWPM